MAFRLPHGDRGGVVLAPVDWAARQRPHSSAHARTSIGSCRSVCGPGHTSRTGPNVRRCRDCSNWWDRPRQCLWSPAAQTASSTAAARPARAPSVRCKVRPATPSSSWSRMNSDSSTSFVLNAADGKFVGDRSVTTLKRQASWNAAVKALGIKCHAPSEELLHERK